MSISFKQKGKFSWPDKFERNYKKVKKSNLFDEYGKEGVQNLKKVSPKDTGRMSQSWFYKVSTEKYSTVLSFHNNDIENGCNVAIIVQYGHGTKNGVWIQGIDYINPSMAPVFEELCEKIWKEITL